MVVVSGIVSLNSEANLLFLLFALSIGVLLVSCVLPILMVRRVDVRRTVPQAVACGTPFSIKYQIRNTRRWCGVWSLTAREMDVDVSGVRFPWAFVVYLPAGSQVRAELLGRCDRRGKILLKGVRVASQFPFGLLSCSVDVAESAEIVVYPAVGWLRRPMIGAQRFSDRSGSRAKEIETGDDEFSGVREYREGDNLRRIHWRRTARTGQLVVQERAPLTLSQLVLLVDPWPDEGVCRGSRLGSRIKSGSQPEHSDVDVERIISAAGTAACDALEHGHRVGLIARAAVPIVIPPAGGRAHRQRILQELANLQSGCPQALDEILFGIRWTSGWNAKCLICTSRLTDAYQDMVRFIGARARTVIVAAPGTEWLENVFCISRPARQERGTP